MNRRMFMQSALASGAALASRQARGADAPDLAPLFAAIEKLHDESVNRLQEWIKHPTITAEDKGTDDGCNFMMQMLLDCRFNRVTKLSGDGPPAVLGTLDAGAPRTIGIYFMYDVKQADPAEWSSPPFEAKLVDKPGLGKVVVGRGAVNQKGPQAAFLAALRAFRTAKLKSPVNIVFLAEGEEEIGSPHFAKTVQRPEVLEQFRKCTCVYMPMAQQSLDGTVTYALGAKGVIELELVSSGERWGRGPKQDLHSSNEARVDSPAWHLVEALATLVGSDGHTPAIDGFADRALPLSAADKALIRDAAKRQSEEVAKKQLGVQHWVHDVDWVQALELLASKPTVNIEGLVGGYTGPGGKTILPHRAVAKLDLRLVPNMTAAGAVAALRAHLAKRGFGDIEVNMTGGYDPTTTSADTPLVRAAMSVYKRHSIDPIVLPRMAGSWPGCVFTGDPLRLPAGHFGLGHGNGAHAPDEYFVIESTDPKIQGIDGAAKSQIEYLYELASI